MTFSDIEETNEVSAAGEFSDAVDLTNIVDGCTVSVTEACDCADWSVITTDNCGDSRTVTFGDC